ncbi:MAG: hypothetical protein JO160_00625, partial [Candidatus Eremiobacteraeota bacterium]|nr:hypothetical protein [Candidatus Eremiobacteraeota bacterium]
MIVRARTIVTCDTDAPQSGISFDALGRIDEGAILVEGDRITAVGKADVILSAAPKGREVEGPVEEIDLGDCTIVPGFVDAHAHPLFAGDREPDFAARQRGEKPALGMLYTVEQTRNALLDPARFYESVVWPRLQTMLAHGTTTLETKTGYALHKPGETALLDLISAHRDDSGVPRLVATFLGAHALPPEFTREEAFVDYLID